MGLVHGLYRGTATLGGVPTAADRVLPDGRDMLVVVAQREDGQLLYMRQTDTHDHAGWTDWQAR